MGEQLDVEFDRQREVLIERGYPALAGLTATGFAELLEPLREVARRSIAPTGDTSVGFVLVVTDALVRAEDAIPLVRLAGGTAAGIVDRNHGDAGLTPYRPLLELGVPDAAVYVLFDVERGEEFRGVRPGDAVPVILGRGRTPLTIHEGIALVTLFPEILQKNRCFMLAGSRRGDRRVPAVWISGKAPKFGWCWEGNPHTWLGTASAAARVG